MKLDEARQTLERWAERLHQMPSDSVRFRELDELAVALDRLPLEESSPWLDEHFPEVSRVLGSVPKDDIENGKSAER